MTCNLVSRLYYMSRLIKGLVKDVAKDTAASVAHDAAYSAMHHDDPQPQPKYQDTAGLAYATYRGCTCNCPVTQDGGLFGKKGRGRRSPRRTQVVPRSPRKNTSYKKVASSPLAKLTPRSPGPTPLRGKAQTLMRRQPGMPQRAMYFPEPAQPVTISVSGCSCTCPADGEQYGGKVNNMSIKQLKEVATVMNIKGRSQFKTRQQLEKSILKALGA